MPEHPWGGAPITLHGHHLTRYAMIHTPDQDPADWPEPGVTNTRPGEPVAWTTSDAPQHQE